MTDGVNMQAFHIIARHHYAQLEALGVDTSNVRCRERVLYLARTLTIRFAVYQMFFQPLSVYRMRKRFDLERFAIEMEKLLVCTEEITNMAFELASSQFVDPNIDPVIGEICRMTRYSGTSMRGAGQDGVVRETSIPSTNIAVTTDQTSSSTGIANFVESCTVQSVTVVSSQTLYSSNNAQDGTVITDYDYVEYKLDLNGLVSDIAARISQRDMALAPPDIKTVLRTLSKQKILARPRLASNMPDMSKPEEFYSVVIIDDFNRSVKILCAYMDKIIEMRGRNIVEEVIDRHRHPKQASYDTLVMIPKLPGFPNLLSRRRVRPCTQEEYEAAGVHYLISVDNTIETREELRRAGLFPQFPTPFFEYYCAFHRPVITFGRFSPETEAIIQHMMITGNDPNEEFKYFPVGQRAFQNIVACAEKLFKIDCNKARQAHMDGVEYEREFPHVKDAFMRAQEMEASSSIRFAPSYPVQQIWEATQKIKTVIHTSQNNVRNRIGNLKDRFWKALRMSGTLEHLDPQDKTKWTAINFDVSPMVRGRIDRAEFEDGLLPMRIMPSGLGICAGAIEEGAATTRNPDQLLLEYQDPNEDDQGASSSSTTTDMVVVSAQTRKRGLEQTYNGIWNKRQHLLSTQIQREMDTQQQIDREREERRRAAQEAIAQSLRPAENQESIGEQDLFENFDEIRPGLVTEADPNMPFTLDGGGMSQQDIMAPINGVVAI
jgi:hypothetical protein